MSFAVPIDHKVKIKENKKIDKYLDLAWKLKKKAVKHEGDDDTSCSKRASQRYGKKPRGFGNQNSHDHTDYNI